MHAYALTYSVAWLSYLCKGKSPRLPWEIASNDVSLMSGPVILNVYTQFPEFLMPWFNENTMAKSMWTFRWEKHISVMRNILISICCDLSRKWDIMLRVSRTVKSISMPHHLLIPWCIATDDTGSNSRRARDCYSRRQVCTKLVGFRHATMVPFFGLITYAQPEYFDFWINFITGMDKKSPQSVGWNYLSIPIQRLHHFSLELDR